MKQNKTPKKKKGTPFLPFYMMSGVST